MTQNLSRCLAINCGFLIIMQVLSCSSECDINPHSESSLQLSPRGSLVDFSTLCLRPLCHQRWTCVLLLRYQFFDY